jgi:hypothetical protein
VLRATFEDGVIASGEDGLRPAEPIAGGYGDRPRVPIKAVVADELYFRGAAYDGYESGRWIHSHKPELRTTVEAEGGRYRIGEDRAAMEGDVTAGSVRQEIEAIGIPASVLIAIDRPRAFELPATKLGAAGSLRVFPRWSGEAALRVGGGEGDTFITLSHAHYVAYSRSPSGGAVAVAPLAPGARAAYLAIPEDLARRLANLAATLGDPDLAASDTIAAVTRALRAKHGYTLEPRPAPAGVDPVESFLLGEHAGHCELFASAAVVLLRLRGIPARYVTGFRGGEWNTVGNYVAVRDDRAHAWAEAFLPDRGWVRVDATPPGAPLPRAGHLSEVMDALDYFWNRWVVGYDLGRQLELARRAGRHLVPRAAHAPARIFTMAAAACLLAALLLAARRLRRRRGRSVHDAHEITRSPIWTAPRLGAVERLYRRTLGRLARAGCPRRGNETPHEYAQRVRASGLISGDDFRQLTERYAAARFGGHDADEKVVAELAAKLAIRTAGPSHTVSPPPDPRG